MDPLTRAEFSVGLGSRKGRQPQAGQVDRRMIGRAEMFRRVDLEMVRVDVRRASIGGEEPAEALDRGTPVRPERVAANLRQQMARCVSGVERRPAGTDDRVPDLEIGADGLLHKRAHTDSPPVGQAFQTDGADLSGWKA